MARRERLPSLRRVATAATALVVCPCHVLYGGATLLAGAAGFTAATNPALQDGLHALYLAGAGLGAALWLRRGARPAPMERREHANDSATPGPARSGPARTASTRTTPG